MRSRSVSRRASCADLLRELRFLDLLERLERFLLARIGFAELRLNRAQLLAQIELALVLLDLDLGLALHVLHHARARDLALERDEDERMRWPTSRRCRTSSLSEIRKFMFVAARSANRPGSDTFILRICGHLVRNAVDELGERLGRRDHARDEVLDLVRVARRSPCAALIDGDRVAARSARSPSTMMRRSPCSVIWTVSPGRLIRSCTRAATPTRPTNLLRVHRLVVIARSRRPAPTIRPGSSLARSSARFSGRAHLHRDRAQRVHDRRPQRHQRQRRRELGLEDVFFALVAGHATVGAGRTNGREANRYQRV